MSRRWIFALPTRLTRGRRAAADERGVVAVIVAISLVCLLGMGALAIDLSSFYKAQRQAQTAADAAALAGSYDLPYSTTAATTDAQSYVQQNDPGAVATISTPYGTANAVKVTVNTTSPSFFGTLFGLTSANISASAVAGGQGTVTQGAIFAYASGGGSNNCASGITLGTNNLTITGGIESNGALTLSTNGSTTLSSGTYGTGCSYTGPANDWTTAPYASAPQNWPIDYTGSLSTCTTTLSGNQTLAATNLSGVYCDPTGTLTISGSSCTGCTVQFKALQIIVSGSGLALNAPFANGAYGLLFYQTGTSNMTMSANSSVLNGAIFAPNATLDISGNSSGTGFIEANAVVFGGNNGNGGGGGNSGNSYTLTGDGPPVASNGYALLQ